MLLSITTTHKPATDLGYLLHKNPANVQSVSTSFGQIHIFYPEASEERCTAALLLDIDPIGLVRGSKQRRRSFSLAQYVNDRPYVASSFLSVAIAKAYGTALNGRSKERPELAEKAIPLEVSISVLPSAGGEEMIKRLFEPLGYEIDVQGYLLDEQFTDWGNSRYFTVVLKHTCRLSELLNHLYVLIPVLDKEKHYWVNKPEIEKLLKRGETWLNSHPDRDLIVKRYLSHNWHLTREALSQLMEEDQNDPDQEIEEQDKQEEIIEERVGLHEQRLNSVLAVLKNHNIKRVIDLGCGKGRLLRKLLYDHSFKEIAGMDVSYRSLEKAQRRLKLDNLPEMQRERIELFQGSLLYRDERLSGYDAAALVEVIEHLDKPRLAAMEDVVFRHAKPDIVVITTPNAEYNVQFENLPAGKFRHQDHRFEWSRQEFQDWGNGVAQKHGYETRYLPIGPEEPAIGSLSQMCIFQKQTV